MHRSDVNNIHDELTSYFKRLTASFIRSDRISIIEPLKVA